MANNAVVCLHIPPLRPRGALKTQGPSTFSNALSQATHPCTGGHYRATVCQANYDLFSSLPLRSLTVLHALFTEAPARTKSAAALLWPCKHASTRAVALPYSSSASSISGAPAARCKKCDMMSSAPPRDAACRYVYPLCTMRLLQCNAHPSQYCCMMTKVRCL